MSMWHSSNILNPWNIVVIGSVVGLSMTFLTFSKHLCVFFLYLLSHDTYKKQTYGLVETKTRVSLHKYMVWCWTYGVLVWNKDPELTHFCHVFMFNMMILFFLQPLKIHTPQDFVTLLFCSFPDGICKHLSLTQRTPTTKKYLFTQLDTEHIYYSSL